MKFKIGQLVLWYYIAYLIFGPLRDVILNRDIMMAFSWIDSPEAARFVFSSVVNFFVYVLATYAILYFTSAKKQQWLRVLLLILMVPGVILFRFFSEEIVQKAIFGIGNYFEGVTPSYYFMDNLYYALFFPWIGGLFYFVQYSKFKEQQQQRLELENQQTQLSLLRAQINPHFLFNSLNNIYSLVNAQSEKSLEAIEKLSGLLRYTLYEPETKVPLSKEIKSMTDYIDLECMRHNFDIPIQLNLDHKLDNIRVIPFLLIPFAENAFKHGVLNDLNKPVTFDLYEKDGFLIFTAKNAVAVKQKDHVGGIGLVNLQRRLSLKYKNKDVLIINKDENNFESILKIPLH